MDKKLTKDEVFSIIKELLQRLAGISPETVKMESKLVDDLELDSLTTLELLMEAEEAFDVSVPESDLRGLTTVEELTSYLTQSANAKR
jgi:acyl carrier protein